MQKSTSSTSLNDQQKDQFPKHPEMTVVELAVGYPAFVIENAYAKATIALHGAHLTEFTPHGESPIIFTSKDAVYREGKAIRGGVPICWPWFNAHPTDSSLPAHGYARTSFWEFESVDSDKSGTTLVFTLPAGADMCSGLSVSLRFHIGKALTLALTTTNNGEEAELYSEALHSYFCVSDSRQAELQGVDGLSYIDTVGPESKRIQSGSLTFPDEVDRIYHHDTECFLIDLVDQREIQLSKTGSGTTIAWNPGVSKGEAMGDLANDEIQKFICVEAGNARDQSVTLEAGEEHTIRYTIGAESL